MMIEEPWNEAEQNKGREALFDNLPKSVLFWVYEAIVDSWEGIGSAV